MNTIEVTAKTVEDAITEALIQLETTSDKIEYEVLEKGSAGFLGFASKPAKIRVRKAFTVADVAKDFLKQVFDTMDMHVEISANYDEAASFLELEMQGSEMGVLIGKRGQTLDSLQYLVSLVVNRAANSYIRVKLDTEDYRKRRRDTLENLAKNIAYRVKRTRKVVSLEPMSPYERRVIHSALQNDRYVSTHSEGEEPFRHVVVTLKK